jgi:biopolymer transport protein ExbD
MKRFDQINVIPFIDIMLVLLAIVLMTATFIAREGIDFDLPKAESAAPASGDQIMEITIDKNGALHFDGVAITLELLDTKLAEVDAEQAIQIGVDRGVAFNSFVQVIDKLKAHNLQHLTILTLPAQ